MKIKVLLLTFVLGGFLCNAQVGIGTPLPNNSAQLDVVAANRGILITRVQLQSTTSMNPVTNTGSLPSSLLVFNEATAGTAPQNVTPGYYYWYNNRWNRIVISSETTVQEGTVIFNPTTNTFSYIDQSGNQQTINFQDIVKNNETITTLVNATDGKHTYTSENNTVTVIDVVGDVVNNSSTILSNPTVVTELTNIIKNNETLTSLVYDATSNTLTYTPENGTATVVNLLDLVHGAETQTSLVYDAITQTLTYNPESGVATVINLATLVAGSETVTTITPVVTTGNTVANYSNEAGTSVAIQETITSLGYDSATSALSYNSEDGTATSIDLTGLKSLVTAGTNVTVTGNGEATTPYVISSPVETALLTPSTAIVASPTTVAVPSVNVQGAIGDLATELKQKWDIKGNADTVAGTNFLGTTDDVNLVFKRNNVQSGLLSTSNTSFGVGANLLSAGNSNVAIGSLSLNANSGGNFNTAVGYNALGNSTNGSFNVAIGYNALSNSIVNNNIAIGYNSLIANTTGTRNVSIGVLALATNSNGNNNIAIGDFSLNTNSTGSNNIATGPSALAANTTGNFNIVSGAEAMISNQGGSSNIATGYRALASNITGSNNTAVGNSAHTSNNTGNNNAAFGDSALSTTISGSNNTALGSSALFSNSGGSSNVAIGFESGRYFGASGTNNLITVNNSVYVGSQARALDNSVDNEVVIGYSALGRGTNTVQIGNSDMTSIGGQVAWSNPSDLRLKKDIETSSFGLNFINKLRPVTYHLKKGTTDLQSGFIAQEVESVANSIGYQFSGIVKPAKENDFYSLRYSEFVVPLVRAVQEQQEIIGKQDKKISDLETRLQYLEEIVSKLK